MVPSVGHVQGTSKLMYSCNYTDYGQDRLDNCMIQKHS